MSPTEDDLRAALHDGEGDALNVDNLVLHARTHLAQRRVRLLSGAAVVAVVAGVGVGIGIASTGSHNTSGSGQQAAGSGRSSASTFGSLQHAPAKAAPSARSAPVAGGSVRADMAVAEVPCPKTFPQYALPGGGSPGQFGANEPLFRKAVSSVVVCGYGRSDLAATAKPARLELYGDAAQRLTASLEGASQTPSKQACLSSVEPLRFAVIGLTSSNLRAGTVTAELATPACNGRVTDGTALRYSWAPPTELRKRLVALTPK